MSTGDRYKVNETSTSVSLQQNRLDTVRFEKITSGTYAGYWMIAEIVGGTDRQEFYYRSGQLVNGIGGATGSSRIIRMGGHCLAQRRDGTQAATTLFGTDGTGTILVAAGHGNYAYTPFGYRPPTDTVPLGYHGERQDPVTGTTHLGNGYRAYNPVLMRFNTPDDWSPFGAGGINRYAYCVGDPINRVDPSGHLSVGA
ncbi:RHS repeat-associated core domain-containing protein [Sorangium sp. So ce1078]|uniref:RHS repeat-associated core domain-containing protein n=1 Tax=Sorangium sp. So ce1078 TaxID=3133329 RepID=UPI003F5EFF6A